LSTYDKKGYKPDDIVLIYHQILRTNPERNLHQRTPDSPEILREVLVEKDHLLYHFKCAKVKNMYLILFFYREYMKILHRFDLSGQTGILSIGFIA